MRRKGVLQAVGMGGTAVIILLFFLQSTLAGGATFNDSGQMLGGTTTFDVALGDIDGDNDLDAIMANTTNNRLWRNEAGIFSNSGQAIGTEDSRGIALADLNNDSFLDAFVANFDADNEVWLNNGLGTFTLKVQTMNPLTDSLDVALGNLDGDSFPDAFVANDGANEVWLNDGTAAFSRSQTLGGDDSSREVALGDVDGDNDLDAYVANGNTGGEMDELWINQGGMQGGTEGNFVASGQSLDTDWNEGVALGDLDGDDDLDIFLAAWFGDNAVWINQGGIQGGTEGDFVDSGQALSSNSSLDVTLIDVDGDTDLDAIIARWTAIPSEIWINDGSGSFSLGETLDDASPAATYEIAAGDIDGDIDPDLFLGNFGANHVWFQGLPGAWLAVAGRVNPDGRSVYPWAQVGDAVLPVQLSYAPDAPLNVVANIESDSDTTMQTIPFSAGQTNSTLTIANPQPAISQTIVLSLTVAGEETAVSANNRFNPLDLIFVDPDEEDEACFLCYADWLLKLLGFEPSFWMLHHMELTDLQASLSWDYYTSFASNNGGEMAIILATNPAVLWQTMDALETWTPAIQTYDDGQGDSVIVSQTMADEALAALEGIRDAASPELADRIQLELDLLGIESYVGLTMDEVATRVMDRVQSVTYLPVVLSQ